MGDSALAGLRDEDLAELDRELNELENAGARESLAVYWGLMHPASIEDDDEPLTDERAAELESIAGKEMAERYVPAAHHREIADKLECIERGYMVATQRVVLDRVYKVGERIPFKRLMIFAPPGSAKSTGASVIFPAWYMGKNPKKHIIQGSYNDSLASRFGRRARNTFNSPKHREVFGLGLARDSRAGGEWTTELGGEYFSFGINTGVTGRRAHGIILDDIIKGRQEANSETVRNNTWDTYISDVRTRMFPGSWIVYIGTRWHEDDPAGRILPSTWNGESGWVKAKDGEWWYVLAFVAIVENTDDARKDPLGRKVGEWLWPEWFPKEHFEQEKVTQGEYNWASLFKQRPQPLEGGIWKKKYFRLWPWDKPLPTFTFILQSYDTSYTEKTMNDPNACTVWGLFKHRGVDCIMLLDNWKDWLEYPELRRRVKMDLEAEYGDDQGGRHPERMRKADLTLIEDKGTGITLRQDLAEAGVEAFPYNPQKADKVTRLQAATPFGNAGMVYLQESKKTPRMPIASQLEFMNDVLKAGPASENWDYADTMSQAVIFLRDRRMIEAKIVTGKEKPPEEDYHAQKRRPNPYAS